MIEYERVPEHGTPALDTDLAPQAVVQMPAGRAEALDLSALPLLISVEKGSRIIGKSPGHVRKLINMGEDFGGALLPKTPHGSRQFSLPRLLRYCGAEEAALRAEERAINAWVPADEDLIDEDQLAS